MRTFYSGSTGNIPNAPTDLVNYYLALSQNNNASNLALGKAMINDEHKKLLQDYFFNENSFTISTVAGQEAYNLPYNYSKLKTGTLTIGNLRWNPTEILSRRDWDNLKTITNYQSDIPNNFFIYNNQFNLWPLPSTTGNTITFNYKIRVPDLTFADYVTGTVSITNTEGVTTFNQLFGGASGYVSSVGVATVGGSGTGCTVNTTASNGIINAITINAPGTGYTIGDTLLITGGDGTASFYVTGTANSNIITGIGTTWKTNFIGSTANNLSVLNQNLWFRINSPAGDGNWYQISTLNTETSLTLMNNYEGSTVVGASYTIGQMPLLLEDFQDIPVYKPLTIYFSTINKDETKLSEMKQLLKEGIEKLDDYCGTKSLNVNLARPAVGENPNLYSQSFGRP